MMFAEHFAQQLHRFDVQRRSFGELALAMQRERQVLDVHRHLRMILPQRRAIDVERCSIQLSRAIVLAALQRQSSQIVEHRGRFRALQHSMLPIDVQALLVEVLGEHHPHTLDALAKYGNFLRRTGEIAKAETVLRDVLDRDRVARGARHVYVGHDHVNLGHVLLEANRASAAETEYLAALDIYRETLPEQHSFIASALSGLGRAQLAEGHTKQAEETLRKAVAMGTATLPPDATPLVLAKNTLGMALLELGQNAEAASLLSETYPILVQTQGANSPVVARAKAALDRVQAQR